MEIGGQIKLKNYLLEWTRKIVCLIKKFSDKYFPRNEKLQAQ